MKFVFPAFPAFLLLLIGVVPVASAFGASPLPVPEPQSGAPVAAPSPSPVAAPEWKIATKDATGDFEGEKPYLTTVLKVHGGEIRVFLSTLDFKVSHSDILVWIRTAALAVSSYYEAFPVPTLSLTVNRVGDSEPDSIHGTTFAGRRIRIRLGAQVTRTKLLEDWVMTHEMLHLAFPEMEDDFTWLQEGMATYVEPLARMRQGTFPVLQYWKELVHGLPQGLPQPGDRGLLYTHTWGRTYWGGALFWFLADLEIREKTGNHHSVDDAFREILKTGGNGRDFWKIEKVLKAGDRATGKDVMHRLYDRLALHAGTENLEEIWKKLGVVKVGKEIRLDDDAPEAKLRRAMEKK